MLKLVKKHDWLELKAENLLLKEEVGRLSAKLESVMEIAKEEADELRKQVGAWQEKKPYCGKHCQACKHGYATQEGIFSRPVYGCYLDAENECYLFTRKEVEEAGK